MNNVVKQEQAQNVQKLNFAHSQFINNTSFKEYLFNDLEEHIERIREIGSEHDPDLESLEYHHEKTKKIVQMLKEG